MTIIPSIQWLLWGLALLTGSIAAVSLFKLRIAQKFLPHFNQLKEIEAALPTRREELRQLTENVQVRRQELVQAEANIGHLHQLREWQKANPDAQTRLSQLKADLEKGTFERAALRQKIAAEETRLKEALQDFREKSALEEARLAQLAQQIQVSGMEKQGLQEQKTLLERERAALQQAFNNLDQKLDDAEEQLDRVLEQSRQIDAEMSQVSVTLQQEKKRLGILQQQATQAEQERATAMRERDQARAARDSANAEITGLQNSIATLKAIAEGIKIDLSKSPVISGGTYADLFVPLHFPKLSPATAAQEERQALERARDYIAGKRLFFPERILHAFHTSLKANDVSPLVVLAGISGTGKSELPRHYADGMGLHFLMVSVQPRWDSPQDLFGFYNYLEKRYKATELARALVQFELFNQAEWQLPDGSEIEDRSDRMLLVLLDEMNLARTEYYFSEFLSKLETRRMVLEDDASNRSRAEIELDMGRLVDGQKSLRLYPGQNVLFAGTMNEDESTQALSDKVLDRASVLRFWRPKETNPALTRPPGTAPEKGLTFTNWKRWRRSPADLGPHAAEIDAWVGRLNEALTKLGRPFAFRVDRAIRSYIANYPRWVSGWHKRAMADQIEHRIFPKLRGIEPDQSQQALAAIAGVIDQLDDPELKQAFRESSENQHTFLFRGVLRS